jgi:hypothetical protein
MKAADISAKAHKPPYAAPDKRGARDVRHQSGKELPNCSGGALNTAAVLRDFLNGRLADLLK